jgi:hypothetical protein
MLCSDITGPHAIDAGRASTVDWSAAVPSSAIYAAITSLQRIERPGHQRLSGLPNCGTISIEMEDKH